VLYSNLMNATHTHSQMVSVEFEFGLASPMQDAHALADEMPITFTLITDTRIVGVADKVTMERYLRERWAVFAPKAGLPPARHLFQNEN
jgi:hypothetical protein